MKSNVYLALAISLSCLTSFSYGNIYDGSLSLEENADLIATNCSSKSLSDSQKNKCFDSASKAYERYIKEIVTAPDDFLTSSIQGEYSDKVLVAIHSYTMSPADIRAGVEYGYDQGATGLYVSLQGHRDDGVMLRDLKGKHWISDTAIMTKIAQGFGEKVILMGFSLGAILSIQQAKTYPEFVSGYVAMAPSFHGGVYLPYSEKSCFARIGIVRGIVEKFSGQDLNNDFILGGCAIFGVSRKIARNIQNKRFAKLQKGERFDRQKRSTKRQIKKLTMPGAIIHSRGDQVVSHQVTSIVSSIISEIAGENFFYKEYDEAGPGHLGDWTYFNRSLEVSAFDAIDFVFKRVDLPNKI